MRYLGPDGIETGEVIRIHPVFGDPPRWQAAIDTGPFDPIRTVHVDPDGVVDVHTGRTEPPSRS